VECTGLPYPSTLLTGRAVCRHHLLDAIHVFGSANSLLYRADLVRQRDPFFDERNIHADTESCFALLAHADFGFVHQVLTFTRVRAGSLYARSNVMQTSWAGDLQVLTRWGPAFLEKDELTYLLREHLDGYYRCLGKSLLQRRGGAFWEYHARRMRECGVRFSRLRVLGGLVRALAELALDPKRSLALLRAAGTRGRERAVPHKTGGAAAGGVEPSAPT
jgi:hypothetical protein